MSIKEALESYPFTRRPAIQSDVGHEEEVYRRYLLTKGIAFLTGAGIPEMFRELREILIREFPDVKSPKESEWSRGKWGWKVSSNQGVEQAEIYQLVDGMVVTSIGWNYKTIAIPAKQEFNAVDVLAQPLTGALIIQGERNELIPQDIWSSSEGKTALEDAIVNAYKNPAKIFWPPAHA
ncbi:hypothetical protein HYT32_01220 [Candidatus Roizmanbacteria bacterium]|nr:hypothetical protein [Candidatus Roizmanbacteria bacterium]